MIPISKPIIGPEEKSAVIAVLDSGQLSQGERVAEFENRFAKWCGVKHAIAVSSGSIALYGALLANGIGSGDEVITTPFSFIATSNAIFFTGARPVFVDIEPDTYNLDAELIEREITEKTKAILAVHLYGHPANMDALISISEKYNLTLIEDAAQAHGAMYNGRFVGSFGTGCFSFYGTKNMTTGEGGMVATNIDHISLTLRKWRNHGSLGKDQNIKIFGSNFRMTEIQAALGIVQLERLPELNRIRQKNARYISKKLTDFPNLIVPSIRNGCSHVFHQYTIRVRKNRGEVMQMLKERGIGVEIYYPKLIPQYEFYKKKNYDNNFPVAKRVSRQVLSLPVHPALTRDELRYIVNALTEVLQC